jgi:hypothetical protein
MGTVVGNKNSKASNGAKVVGASNKDNSKGNSKVKVVAMATKTKVGKTGKVKMVNKATLRAWMLTVVALRVSGAIGN